MINFIDALIKLRPNSEWSLSGSKYKDLIWNSTNTTKPTEEEIQAKIAELQAAEPLRLLRIERNQILQQSDWEVQRNTERNIIDSNLIDYRNALRDLPQEIENGNIPAPTLDEYGMLMFDHWPTRYAINTEETLSSNTANNSANTV